MSDVPGPADALPCPICGEHPDRVMDGSGQVKRYVEQHEPDCPMVIGFPDHYKQGDE